MSKSDQEEWFSLKDELGLSYPPIVACMLLPTGDHPLLSSDLKIVIFLNQDEAKKYVSTHLTPKTDEERAEIRELERRIGTKINPPLISQMGQEKWELFQREQVGRYRVFTTAEAAAADAKIKRERFSHLVSHLLAGR